MEFLKAHQLDFMLFMSGICGILAVLTVMTRSLSRRRKCIIASLEAACMLLLLSDRFAHIYQGDVSALGFWMVRISNFLVFFLIIFFTHMVTLYLLDLFRNEGKISSSPKRFFICIILFCIGAVLIVISQFTGLYYTFDANNHYQRSPGFLICYLLPTCILMLQISLVVQYRKTLGHRIAVPMLLTSSIPIAASVIQVYMYGLSLTNMSIVGVAILLYIFVLTDLNDAIERAKKQEIELYMEQQEREHELFEQTAEALANAIDAKDKYTLGHSSRVAAYSKQIAREAGMSDEQCERVYFAGLLHDVGKIGIADNIINKDGKLTNEEFAQIKLHPVYGKQILSQIHESPYLSVGANHHHERYDGRGYPDGLKGSDIPEIARIIGVADAYDAMTSKRSYRDPIPQDKVREELVKGMGTQFDPKYAKIMLHLIDLDTEYRMQELEKGTDWSSDTVLTCESVYHKCSVGIHIVDSITRIRLSCRPMAGSRAKGRPVLILFDSLDGRVQDTEEKKIDLLYVEYGQVYLDGNVICEEARKMEVRKTEVRKSARNGGSSEARSPKEPTRMVRYDIEAMRYKDHMKLTVSDAKEVWEVIVALPDSTRFSYISLTGEHCVLQDIRVEQEDAKIGADAIPRIAEEISYIRGCPVGDIPNVQVDGWCTEASEGIPLRDSMKLTFHSRSLPTARLVWHCPYVSLYTAKDGKVRGEGFHEFVLIRLDGETWESDEYAENTIVISHTLDFAGWDAWKKRFKEGLDCEVHVRREGSLLIVTTENLGVMIRSVTTLLHETEDVYVALTGDQCAITDIHFSP